jgi:hypothetical protein
MNAEHIAFDLRVALRSVATVGDTLHLCDACDDEAQELAMTLILEQA